MTVQQKSNQKVLMEAKTKELLEQTPKADLHLHLEGTVDLETLHLLAERNKVDLEKSVMLSGAREIQAPLPHFYTEPFRQGSFRDFIRLYVKISECIQSGEDLVFLARRYAEKARRENVIVSEIYVTPTTLTALKLKREELFEGLHEAEHLLAREFNLKVNWIFDIVRNSPVPGDVTLDFAKAARAKGVSVAALGVAGLEEGYPALPFQETLAKARWEGFQILIHAGETQGPESIRDALNAGPPLRIGHGISILRDETVVQEIIAREIPLEICLASNLALCPEARDGNHPLKQIYERGIPFTLASDDPGIFGSTLLDNYEIASGLGIPDQVLLEIARNSLSLAIR